MFRLVRLAFQIAPYALVPFGVIMAIVGGSAIMDPGPESPVETSIADMESAQLADLPRWISVKDGLLYWVESAVVYTEGAGTEEVAEYESMLVPLVSPQTLALWYEYDQVPQGAVAYLVEYPWSVLVREFPYLASAARMQDRIELAESGAGSSVELTFEPQNAESAHLFGPGRRIVEDLLALGFAEVVAVNPGSAPLNGSNGLALVLLGAGSVFGGVRWIRARRRRTEEGLAKAVVALGVEAAVQRAIQANEAPLAELRELTARAPRLP